VTSAVASLGAAPVESPAVIPIAARKTRPARLKRGQMTFLTPVETLAVLKVAKQRSTRDWAMILLAYRHGLRILLGSGILPKKGFRKVISMSQHR